MNLNIFKTFSGLSTKPDSFFKIKFINYHINVIELLVKNKMPLKTPTKCLEINETNWEISRLILNKGKKLESYGPY